MQGISRRSMLAGLIGVAGGATTMFVATDDAQGAQVSVEGITLPDKDKSVSSPVTGLTVNINGSLKLESSKPPSKIVLRAMGRANKNNEFKQIAATDWRSDLTANMERDFSIAGDLLVLDGVSASELTPQNVGETAQETVTIKLVLEVFHDSKQTKTHTVEDETTIQITKQEAQTTANITASGDISVLT